MNMNLLDAFKIPVEYTPSLQKESQGGEIYCSDPRRTDDTFELSLNNFYFDVVFYNKGLQGIFHM